METKAAYPGGSRLQHDHMDQLRQPGDIRFIAEEYIASRATWSSEYKELFKAQKVRKGEEGKRGRFVNQVVRFTADNADNAGIQE